MAADMIDYSREGEHALKDISFALVTGEVSKLLPSSIDEVFLNLTTKENENFCVRLCMDGFQVVGHNHDQVDEDLMKTTPTYETVYALMESISPSYTGQFTDQLFSKLSALTTPNNTNEENQ